MIDINEKLDEAISLLRSRANGGNIHRVAHLLQYLEGFKLQQNYSDALKNYATFMNMLVEAFADKILTQDEKEILRIANEHAYQSVNKLLNN